jgi:hypothetical protein
MVVNNREDAHKKAALSAPQIASIARKILSKVYVCFDGADIGAHVETLRSDSFPLSQQMKLIADDLLPYCQKECYKAMMSSRNLGFVPALFEMMRRAIRAMNERRRDPTAPAAEPLDLQPLQECLQSLAKTTKCRPDRAPIACPDSTDLLSMVVEVIRQSGTDSTSSATDSERGGSRDELFCCVR